VWLTIRRNRLEVFRSTRLQMWALNQGATLTGGYREKDSVNEVAMWEVV
jgi:hypothetical protein